MPGKSLLIVSAVLALSLAVSSIAVSSAADEPPATATPSAIDPVVEAYAALPSITDLQISPDGKRIAAISPVGGVNGLTVIDLVTQKQNVALAADPARYQLNGCRWANETRLVCQVRMVATMALGGDDQARFATTAIFAVDHDGQNLLRLSSDATLHSVGELNRGSYVSLLPNDRDHILVSMLDPKAVGALQQSVLTSNITLWPDVWKIDIYNGKRTRLIKARDGIATWIADDQGEVRGGLGTRTIARDTGDWHTLDTSAFGQDPDNEPLGVGGEGRFAYIAARIDDDRRGAYEMDTRTTRVTRTLFTDPRFDFQGAAIVRHGEPQALITSDDTLRLIPLSDAWKALDAELKAALPGQSPVPWSMDDAEQRFTVVAGAPDQPRVWYFFDRPARKLIRIGFEHPRLQGPLPLSTWVEYKAADGTTIPARLTLPSEGARNLPAVLLPHGGPVGRDQGFSFVASFLARRGYAVLEPQYRGSFGYGKTFLKAGDNQWGLAMQTDVVDGLAWLRAEGIADSKHACIVGLSYGGYVALVAAYKTPDQFRCAVSYAGLSDLPTLVSNFAHYDLGRRSQQYLHLSSDPDVLEANSPLINAARFGIPVLLMHADRDTNVLVEQSRTLAAALQASGKTYRYIEQANGDHYLGVQTHRREFLTQLDGFLHTYLSDSGSPRSSNESTVATSQRSVP